MIEPMRWFDRRFPGQPEPGTFPAAVERVRGTPDRLEARLAGLAPAVVTRHAGETWSAQENVGHLLDLEPLWVARLDDLLAGRAELTPADLENRATHAAGHDARDLAELLAGFRTARGALVGRLDRLGPADVERSARHPRLERPMRTIDLVLFVADHDDHHLARITRLVRGA